MATLRDLLKVEGIWLQPAGKRHARDLARCMRPEDIEEIKATGGFIPEPAVRASINRAEEAYAAYRGDKNGDLLCVFGVTVLEQVQAPWMLASVHVAKHSRVFWRCSKIAIEHLRGKYPLMMNMVHGQNREALRWLERLGFTLSPPEKFGVRGDLFCRATLVTQKINLSIPSDLSNARMDELRRLIHV